MHAKTQALTRVATNVEISCGNFMSKSALMDEKRLIVNKQAVAIRPACVNIQALRCVALIRQQRRYVYRDACLREMLYAPPSDMACCMTGALIACA